MLDTEQTDTLGTEFDSLLCILRIVGVGTHAETAVFVNNLHELHITDILSSVDCADCSIIYKALGTVEREYVALVILLAGDVQDLLALCA